MQTSTQIAFAKAGIKPQPINRQIWSYLKANPEKTSREVAAGLGVSYSCSSSLLSAMQRQGTVGVIGTRPVARGISPKIYNAVGEYFKPAKKRGAQKAKTPVQQALSFADVLVDVLLQPGQPLAPAINLAPEVHHASAAAAYPAVPEPIKLEGVFNCEALDRYTLGELRHIHAYLSTIFAGERLHVSANLTRGTA